ncbi:hypothetical protein TVAG_491760 [Trichomonas vaginalis G3]|uniref:Transmembrane protein n=1 Tax=Trichomonas vaginalis (strain ATCC PRA-98 / G3) TaxID=412133 RepID=A2EAK7_TRIV3|nr:hypothetical protein TVAGG3_1004430 [Trichomonas vaginalis G3]EAY10318.1 hypothetical protein TVAG_491760 [Trichomonas vaginalis G3]KAI5491035.1 hypothetical protein TVAGG3_1004430 [Trichomonas vaginalis G3]|eukprot:XP_001322541.1 hypothetical protein [Trichomonas vaginalis G3]
MFLFISTAICSSFDYCYSKDTSQCPSSSERFVSYDSLVEKVKEKQKEASSFSITIILSTSEDITFDFSNAPNTTSFTFQSNQLTYGIKFKNTRPFTLNLRNIKATFEGSQLYTFQTLDIDTKSEINFPKDSALKCQTLICTLSLLESLASYDASKQLTILIENSPSNSFTTPKTILYVKLVTNVKLGIKTVDSATTVTFPNEKQIIIPFITTKYKSPSATTIEVRADSTYDADYCNMFMEIPELVLQIYNSKVTVNQHRKDIIARLIVDLHDDGKIESDKYLDIYKILCSSKGTSVTAPYLQVPGSWKMFNNSEVNLNAKENYIDEIYFYGNCKINSDFGIYTKMIDTYRNDKDTEQIINSDVYILGYISYGQSKVSVKGIYLEQGAFLQCVCINGEVTPLKVTKAESLNISFCTDPSLETKEKEALFDKLYIEEKNKFNVIESDADIKINIIPNTVLGTELPFFQISAVFLLKKAKPYYTIAYFDSPMSYNLRLCYGGEINNTRCSLLPRFYSKEYNDDWKKQVKAYTTQVYIYFYDDDKEYTIDASDIKFGAELVLTIPEKSKLILNSSKETAISGLGLMNGTAKVNLDNFNKLSNKMIIENAQVDFVNSEKLGKLSAVSVSGSVVSFDKKVYFSGKSYHFETSKITGDLDFSKAQKLQVDINALNIFDPNPQNLKIYLTKDVEKIDLQHNKLEFTLSNKEKVTVKAIHSRTIAVDGLPIKTLTLSCSGTDEKQIPRLEFIALWNYNIVGEWPQTELPLVFAETRIMNEFLQYVNVNVKTEGAFPLGLAHTFSGRNVYLDSEKDVKISYNLKPIEDNFYPYFHASKNVYLKKIQLTDDGGIGYVTNTSNKFYIDEVDASGQSIELNNVEVRNMTMIKSSITGFFTNFVDSYVTMNVPVNNQWLSTFNTNGKCNLNLFYINDDRNHMIANSTQNIFCCDGGLSVKKLKTDTGNLHVKDKCIVFTPSISSSKLRLILLITIPCCVLVLIVVVILIVFISKRSHKNKFETSTELTATLL